MRARALNKTLPTDTDAAGCGSMAAIHTEGSTEISSRAWESRCTNAERGLPAKSSKQATVGVLAGRNPALPEVIPQWPWASLEDFPHVKKKKKRNS